MIRRMCTYILVPLALAVLVFSLAMPSQMPAKTVTLPSPTPTMAYPDCASEDGSGQALCMWDAGRMGNGVGTSVVSGDCALTIEHRDLCVALYSMPTREVAGQGGSYETIPNGADLVRECNSELQEEFDAIELGWNLGECYKAWM